MQSMPSNADPVKCSVVTYKVMNITADSFVLDSGSDIYPVLMPADPGYVSAVFQPMVEALHKAVQRHVERWKTIEEGCPDGWSCIASGDPKDIVISSTRILLSVRYVFPDGTDGVLYGSYQLEIRRAAGTCIRVPDNIRALKALLRGWTEETVGASHFRGSEEQ
jgi:hypothetical protein